MADDLSRTLETLFPHRQVVEMRALGEDRVASGYYDDYARLAEHARALDADPAVHGIYVTLNEVNPALLARRANRIKMRLHRKDATTGDGDILRRRWLPIDIDPVRPSGVSATDAEHARALQRADAIAAWLADLGFPGAVRGDSGNGAHLLYRIDLENTDENRDLVKRCLEVVAALHGDDTVSIDTAVCNAARIWKLYGTRSRKGDDTPERPHRRSRLISVPPRIETVPRTTLERLANCLPAAPAAPKGSEKIRDLAAWLQEHRIGVKSRKPYQGGTLFVLEACPFSSAHTDGAFAIQFGNGALYAGCHHASCGGGKQRWAELRGRFEPAGRRAAAEDGPSSPQDTDPSEQSGFTEARRARAEEILARGDPRGFILSTFQGLHVGDAIVAECFLVSVVASAAKNSRGLHVCPTGDSGKGKSDAAQSFLKLVPAPYKVQGSISSKSLFYHEIHPGSIVIFDDVNLNEDLREILKNATSDFQNRLLHHTISMSREAVVRTFPPGCTWWILSVENPGDDQILNRMLKPWIDDTEAQDRRVQETVYRQAALSQDEIRTVEDVAVCQAIVAEIKRQSVYVRIPFADRIRIENVRNRRNTLMLLDLIRSFAILNYRQRVSRTLRNGQTEIDAAVADFEAAVQLCVALDREGGQTTKLLKNEHLLIETVLKMHAEEFTVKDLQNWMGLSYDSIRRILHGRPDRSTWGLLAKCPAFGCVDTTTLDETETPPRKRREYHYTFDAELYRAWMRNGGIWLAEDDGPLPTLPTDPDGGQESRARDDTADGASDPPSEEIAPSSEGADPTLAQISPTTGRGEPAADDQVCDAGASHDSADVGKSDLKPAEREGIEKPDTEQAPLSCPPSGQSMGSNGPVGKRGVIREQDYIALPRAVDQPCHLCGRRPTSSVKRIANGEEPQYLCYDCLKRARSAGQSRRLPDVKRPGTIPLAGVLDHRDFTRMEDPWGKCDICRVNSAAYRSSDRHSHLCGVCYQRLVREWNQGQIA
ncbi:MAG: hypothetical protein QMD46_09870 [Methanomicrobiales archaeon]|nr:hypothetical protein [Methanomicrobiales archaeon]